MKVGDYVRSDRGIIAKITNINKTGSIICDRNIYFGFNVVSNKRVSCDLSKIIKSSPNIIDLIEKFDLVNGHLVICKMYENEKDIPTIVKCVGDYYFKEDEIKSIVTKEQFESMEYKVKE